jgi:hypothetical protein
MVGFVGFVFTCGIGLDLMNRLAQARAIRLAGECQKAHWRIF